MFAADTTKAAAATATEAVKPSFTETLIAQTSAAVDHLLSLDPREAAWNGLISAAIVLAGFVIVRVVHRLLDHWLAQVSIDAQGVADKEEARAHKAARLSWWLFRLVAAATVLVLVLGVWGIDARAWVSGAAGARLLRLALVIILATALVELAGFVITRLIDGFARRSADARRAAQLRTLGPILKGSAQGLLVVIGVLTVLTEVGMKVAPILASAGVLGIAVGFGAQTIVKDFLTGLFLIAEDVVSVGDNVQIADSSGVVEAMTLRTIRLRDANATLHIFPYSEAQVIHNRTKIFSSYLAEIPVSYDTDVDRALAVIKKVGDELKADAHYGALITQPFEVMGVDRLADNAIHLKARFITVPRAQWEIGREFNRRIINAFDAAGIRTPVKTTPVAAQPLEDPKPEPGDAPGPPRDAPPTT